MIRDLWWFNSLNQEFESVNNVFIEVNLTSYNKVIVVPKLVAYANKLFVFKENDSGHLNETYVYDKNDNTFIQYQPTVLHTILSKQHVQISNLIYGTNNKLLVAYNTNDDTVEYLVDASTNYNIVSYYDFNLSHHNGVLYFNANIEDSAQSNISEYGNELYQYSINNGSVSLIADINDNFDDGGYPRSSEVDDMVIFNDSLYFSALDGITSRKLYTTSLISHEIVEVSPDTTNKTKSSSPRELTPYLNELYFIADHPVSGTGIWRYNPQSGQPELLKSFEPTSDKYAFSKIFIVNEKLYYAFRDENERDQLWAFDEINDEHSLIIKSGGYYESPVLNEFAIIGSSFFFKHTVSYQKTEIMHLNTLTNEVIQITNSDTHFGTSPINLTFYNNKLYFIALDEEYTRSLRVLDPKDNNISTVNPSNYEGEFELVTNTFVYDDKLYFTHFDGKYLLSYDEKNNTVNENEITLPFSITNSDRNIHNKSLNPYLHNGSLYIASEGPQGNELYKYDSEDTELTLIRDINEGEKHTSAYTQLKNGSYPHSFFDLQNRLHFIASTTNDAWPYYQRINDTNHQNSLYSYDDKLDILVPLNWMQPSLSESYNINNPIIFNGYMFSGGSVIKNGVYYGSELIVINLHIDTDDDGIEDDVDTDDDGDGTADDEDAFPLDATESVDTDNDGIGNNADNDDDNDGVEDSSDAYPLDSSRSSNSNSMNSSNSSSNSEGGGSIYIMLFLLCISSFIKLEAQRG